MASAPPNSQIQLPSSSSSSTGVSTLHAAILAVLIEIGITAIVIMIAGINDDIANVVLVFMFGILLLFLIMHSTQVSEFVGGLTAKEQAAE